MDIKINNLIYIRYSRKSSEAKERQALSIPDQNKECDELEQRYVLNVKYKLQEEKSAYKPNNRPKYKEMVELITSGKANAILTWKPDRICRNPLEGGQILQLLQDGILKEIRTPLGDVYTPESDHLILQIHFGMANQYSRNLSQNVRRGLKRKIEDRHEYPRPAPLGYEGYGERGQRNIRPNPVTSAFIQKAFRLASTGVYSLNDTTETLFKEGLRTRRGKKVSKSHMDTILHNPLYYGFFYHNGELFEGNYQPIVEKGLYDLVQDKLNDRSKPKVEKWQREFVRLFRCGNCGCAITTSNKKKFIKKTREWKQFIYHHCTHRRGNCHEMPVTDADLKDILYKELEKIEIDKEVWQLGVDLVKAKYKKELEANKNQHYYFSVEQNHIRDKVQRLTEMRADEELTHEEYLEQKNKLISQLESLEAKTQDNNDTLKTWLELAEDFFNTAFQVRDIMLDGTPEQKQKVLAKVGENFILKSKMLTFSFKQPYDVLLKPEYRTDVLRD